MNKYEIFAKPNPQFQDTFPRLYPEFKVGIDAKGKEVMSTKNITFVSTEACNLKCTYCYQCNKHHKRKMSKEVAKKAVDMIFDKEKMRGYIDEDVHKCIIIDFIGGEPFLNVEVMDFILEYFRYKAIENNSIWANNYMINVTTNGTLNHTEEVKNFIRKHKKRLSIGITIDGDKELHDSCRIFHDNTGSYDVVSRNMKDAIKEFGLDNTKVTLAPENIDKINTAIPHLFEIGLKFIYANCVFEDVWEDHHAPILYKELIKLADWMIENEIYKTGLCSIFDETIGKPMDTSDNRNWCFRKGTMVLTPDGNKRIEDLKIGDYVITHDGSEQKIIDVMTSKSKKTASIKASGMFETNTTANHPYLTKKFKHVGNKGVRRYKQPDWVEVEDLNKKDKIALYAHTFGDVDMDKNIAYIVGRYIGDGWFSTTGYKICCGHHEYDELKAALDVANVDYSVDLYETVYQFNIFKKNTELLEILSQIGKGAYSKNIPAQAFTWDKESVLSMLKGLYDADGYYKESEDVMVLNTISPTLSNDILILLRGLGYYPTCYLYKRAGESSIQGRKVNIKDRYEIYFKLDKTKSKYCKRDEEKDHIYWSTVRNVNLDTEPYTVYNLTVANNNSYVANGAIVHNCGGDGSMLAVGTDGKLFPCIRYMEYSLTEDGRKQIEIGNVDDGIYDYTNNETVVEIFSITRKSQSTDECFNCEVASGCAWCSGYNYDKFGTANKRATYICKMHKARILASYYYYNKIYKKHNIDDKFEMNLKQEDIDFITEGKGLPTI